MGEERIRPTRSGLFMIELLIAVGVFTLCAAVCVGLFVRAEVMSRESADLTRAVAEARSVAECWKAAGGDFEKTAELCGGTVEQDTLVIGFDRNWEQTASASDAAFFAMMEPVAADGYAAATLRVVRRENGGEALLNWNDLAALEVTP